MQKEGHLFDDLARVAGGAMTSFTTLRDEAEARLKTQFERILASMDLVRRDEFQAVKAMAAKARKENAALAARLDALEGKRARKTGTRATKAKAPARSAKPKTAASKAARSKTATKTAARSAKSKSPSSRSKAATTRRPTKSSATRRRKT
jgi:BMFP domain-containing protein YqiC